MAPCLICDFIVTLFYIERKWLLMRNLARILPSKSKMSGKFHCFNAIYRSMKILKKIVEFTKNSIKIKNCKTFTITMPKKRAALMKLFSFPQTHP